MESRTGLPGQSMRWMMSAALVLGVSACGITIPEDPTTARVTATGESPSGTFMVITSTDFSVGYDSDTEGREVRLAGSDTAIVQLPFDREFDLGEGGRFYAAGGSPDGEEEVSLEMALFIEDQERFRDSGTLTDQLLEFIYVQTQFGP